MSQKMIVIILVSLCFLFLINPLNAFSFGTLFVSVVNSKPTPLAAHTTTTAATVSDGSSTDGLDNSALEICSSNLHLISLPPVSDKSPKLLRDVWKWKDVVLGDGRDYFVPRPRALKALSDVLVGSSVKIPFQSEAYVYSITECAILSNCARMDVLLVMQRVRESSINDLKSDSESKLELFPSSSIVNDSAKVLVTKCILEQLESFQKRRKKRGTNSYVLVEGLSSVLDLPGMVVDTNEKVTINLHDIDFYRRSLDDSKSWEQSQQLEFYQLLNSTNNIIEIVKHFSTVAAGIAPRASRPDRDIIFRPFSSRDAHIMLQLKRTVEVANAYPKVKVVLDSALTAGKAARDPKICTILEKLKPFAAEGKYSQKAPPLLEKEAIESVMKLAIEPAIETSIIRLTAMGASEQIFQFQRMMDEMLQNIGINNDRDENRKQIAKKLTHQSITRLRSGERLDLNALVCEIEEALIDF